MIQHERAGFIGGALFSLLGSVHIDDFISTCILAIVGASVSFITSIILKQIAKRFKKRKKH